MIYFWIAAGGALGAAARFGLTGWIHGWAGASVPWGTAAVNLVGSFALGFGLPLMQVSLVSGTARAFVGIGFLGAFTTFSTYTFETVALLQDGQWLRATLYALGSLGFGVAAVLAGAAMAHLLLRTGG